MVDRMAMVKALRGKINKDHGAGTIGLASKMQPIAIPRISTGSLAFDFALGGGIAAGRTTMLWGYESSGKTTQALRIAGIAQNLCANCLRPVEDIKVVEIKDKKTGESDYVGKAKCDCYNEGLFIPRPYPKEKDADFKARLKGYKVNSYDDYRVALIDQEGDYREDWGGKFLDQRRMLYVRPDTAEEAIDIYVNLMATGGIDMFIVDSIAMMTPSGEVEASAEEWQQGLQARLVNKWVRTSQSTLTSVSKEFGRIPTQIWINQVREKIGVKYGSPDVMPAGNAQKFAAGTIVKLKSSIQKKDTAVFDERLNEANQQRIAKSGEYFFDIIRNKYAPPKATGSFRMRLSGKYAGAIEEGFYILDVAEQYQIVERIEEKKGKVTWRLGDEMFKTQKAMIERVREPEVMADLKELLLKKMLGARDAEDLILK